MNKGFVFDVKRYALHDGEGIRTTLFLKGCPLRCAWCHNPEGISVMPILLYAQATCMHCLTCLATCQQHALCESEGMIRIDHEACTRCGDCAYACPTNALRLSGKRMSVEEVEAVIRRDHIFYTSSHGGVTFSGGEVFSQPDFLLDCLKMCKRNGWDTAIETSFFTSSVWIDRVKPYVDQFYIDIKLMDDTLHQHYTGQSNQIILDNIRYLANSDAKIILRTPLIPKVTATKENLSAIRTFISSLPRTLEVELLNYNPLAKSKYPLLQQDFQFEEAKPFTQQEVDTFYEWVRGNRTDL